MAPRDHRYTRFIRTYEWQQIRAYHLRHNPLCVFCKAQGRIQQAEQVDHIEVCGDDPRLQRDPLNLRSLCRECHRIRHGARQKRVIGVDGWPVE